MKKIILTAFVAFTYCSFGQVESCLSGPELANYTAALDGDLIEVTESQFACMNSLSGILEVGDNWSTLASNPNSNGVFSGDWTEIMSPTNSAGVMVEIPQNHVLIGFAFTNSASSNTVGPRVATVGDSIIQPHNADITVIGPGDKYFVIKNPSELANETTHLGLHSTDGRYSPHPYGTLNYRYVPGAPLGITSMSTCNCPTPFIAGLALPSGSLGNNAELVKQEIKIHPNPVTESMTIDIQATEKIEVDIYSVTGELVLVTENRDINCSELPQGAYYVKVQTETGVYNSRFIKK